MSNYLAQLEEVGEVGPWEVWYPLLYVHLVGQRFCLPIPPHLHCGLPDVGRDERSLDPLKGGVQTREVSGEHVMPVL